MLDTNCKAVTASGTRCNITAGASGYCHIHDPKKITERIEAQRVAEDARQKAWAKGERLREVVKVIESTCHAKGWRADTTSEDRNNWLYATVSVERKVPSSLFGETVNGVFDISVLEGGLTIAPQQTSLRGYGFKDLHECIVIEVGKLTWFNSTQKAPRSQPLEAKAPTPLQQLEGILRRFHVAAKQLSHRHENRGTLTVTDEYDVQDLLHVLLRTAFDDVRVEDPVSNRAGASSRTDFVLKKEKIIVEAKMANDKLRDKKIGEGLIIDIERYQSHPDCKMLVCFVYDPNHCINNPSALENDLSRKRDDLDVRVFVFPH